MWVFGYGSLIWRADFPVAERRPAWICGWQRRFWQASTDHRGTPDAPGRVATIIEAPQVRCYGVAYRLDPREQSEVMARLDVREKNGYDRLELPIYFNDDEHSLGITYHATTANPHFLGPAPMPDMARQIAGATGPSGSNTEYLLKLADALDQLGADDDHVACIANEVRRLDRPAADP